MNKLYLSEDRLNQLYHSNGVDYIIELLNNAETIIYTDEFSSNLVKTINNKESIIKYFK